MKNPIHKQMLDSFHTWYLQEKGIKFIWDAKQNKQIDLIYGKIVLSCAQVGSNTEQDTILQLFIKILASLSRADKWVYDNVSPALVNSKYNELVAKIRNLDSGKGNYNSMKVDLINKMFGNGK